MPFKLAGRLSLDGSSFRAGITKAKSAVAGLGKKMKSALKSPMVQMGLAAGAAMIGLMVKKTIDWGTNMRDLGVKFGVTTKFLQEMEFAATQTGLTLEGMMKAYKKMSIAQAIIVDPATSAGKRDELLGFFKTLGVAAEDVMGLSTQDLFMATARSMKNFNAAAVGAQDAVSVIFGKQGTELINTFANDIDGLVESFGGIGMVADETIEKLGAVGDKMEEIGTRWQKTVADVMGTGFGMWDDMIALGEAFRDEFEQPEKPRVSPVGNKGIGLIMERVMRFFKNVPTRQADILNKKKSDRVAALKKKRDDQEKADEAQLKAKLKADVEAAKVAAKTMAAAEIKKKADADAQVWGGNKATGLERIGGRIGTANTQLNISQKQLALMIKAQEKRSELARYIQSIHQQLNG